MSKVYVGDVGTEIALDCGSDVSAATARSIAVRLPDGTEATWAAVADGTNGIKYTTVADTLSQSGTYLLQAVVTLPSGTWRGETTRLRVFDRFR